MTATRPNPDVLLGKLQREDEKQHRGKLKIFFGACAGVGKTFALLKNAHASHAQNVDVVIGIAETHGRIDTLEQLEGLEQLPLKEITYHNKIFYELNVDAAIERKPALILADELAHTNVTGSRHAKRWQDIEELLNAGIDVHTTVNVQHLESLNDIIARITGIRVSATFPDRIFDTADEVTLVDLPPDELLQRLKEGKVYVPEQTQQATENFFRKGNLIALRELALRRMADRVDVQMREYRTDQSIQHVWQTKERLLVCVGPSGNNEIIIRNAYRLAMSLHADWIAIYIETPKLQKLPKETREKILKSLSLAQQLGAETITLGATDRASMLIDYAYSRNISKIILGPSYRSRFSRWLRPSLAEKLTNKITEMDICIIGHNAKEEQPQTPTSSGVGLEFENITPKNRWPGYLLAIISCAFVTLAALKLTSVFDFSNANVVMLYLLAVTWIAARFGRGPSIFASLLNVLAFDFFFIPPTWTLYVSHATNIFTFGVMLAVAVTISNLTSNLRYQAHVAIHRERRSKAMYALSKELSAALTIPHIVEISSQHLQMVFKTKIMLFLPDRNDVVKPQWHDPTSPIPTISPSDLAVAQWVYDNQQAAGRGTQTLPASKALYLPLRAPMRTRGVLAIIPNLSGQISLPEQQRLLDAFAAQIALALERVHYVDVANDAVLLMESERLHNFLLTVISQNLHSPLIEILNLSHQLMLDELTQKNTEFQQVTSHLYEKAQLVNHLVTNLTDMAKLQGGDIKLHKQWQSLNNMVRNALTLCQAMLELHQIEINIPEDLPMIYVDSWMIERLFSNLLENSGKYTPSGSKIIITAEKQSTKLWMELKDNGPGLPVGMEEKIFSKFTRGEKQPSTPGVGLGLSICRTIIEAHGGQISASNLPQGGARFTFWLPLETSAD